MMTIWLIERTLTVIGYDSEITLTVDLAVSEQAAIDRVKEMEAEFKGRAQQAAQELLGIYATHSYYGMEMK